MSTDDLKALKDGKIESMSTEGLKMFRGGDPAPKEPSAPKLPSIVMDAAKSAGQLIAHAANAVRQVSQPLADYSSKTADRVISPVSHMKIVQDAGAFDWNSPPTPKAAREFSQDIDSALVKANDPKTGSPALRYAELDRHTKIAMHKVNSEGLVHRLTGALEESVKQAGLKPSKEEMDNAPGFSSVPLASRGVRAAQALIDNSLPGVKRFQEFLDKEQLPLAHQLDSWIGDLQKKQRFEEEAIAPVENGGYEPARKIPTEEISSLTGKVASMLVNYPHPTMATRVGVQMLNQATDEQLRFAKSMLNPVSATENYLLGESIGLAGRGVGRAALEGVSRYAPKAGLDVLLSHPSEFGKDPMSYLTKRVGTHDELGNPIPKEQQMTTMERIHANVDQAVQTATAKIKAELKGTNLASDPTAWPKAEAAAYKAGYEAWWRKLTGLSKRRLGVTGIVEEGLPGSGGGPDGGGPSGPGGPRRYDGGPDGGPPGDNSSRKLLTAPVLKFSADPKEQSAMAIGAKSLGPDVGSMYDKFSGIGQVLVYGRAIPPAVSEKLDSAIAKMNGGVPPQDALGAVVNAVTTGSAPFIELNKLDEEIKLKSLQAQGVKGPITAHYLDAENTSTSQPGRTLIYQSEKENAHQQATVERAAARKVVYAEAQKEAQAIHEAHLPPPEPPEAPTATEATPEPQEPAASHAEAVSTVPEDQQADAGDAHDARVRQAVQNGTATWEETHDAIEHGAIDSDEVNLDDFWPSHFTVPEGGAKALVSGFEGLSAEHARDLEDEMMAQHVEDQTRETAENEAAASIKADPVHAYLEKNPISEQALKKLGVHGEFKNLTRFKKITTRKGGLKVDEAVQNLIEGGFLPEGSTSNEMAGVLDDEDRAKAGPSMIGEEKPAFGGPGETPDSEGKEPGRAGGEVPHPPESSQAPQKWGPYGPSIDPSIEDVKAQAEDWLPREASARGMENTEHFKLQIGTHYHMAMNQASGKLWAKAKVMPEAEQKAFMKDWANQPEFKEGQDAASKYAIIRGAHPEIYKKIIPHTETSKVAKVMEGFKPLRSKAEVLKGITPAFKDPKTGKVYTGKNHAEIAKAIEDPAAKKIATDAADKNTDAVAPAPETKAMVAAEPAGMFLKYGDKTYPIKSIAQAQQMWDTVRDEAMVRGASPDDMADKPIITDADGKTLGHISWNGRVWKGEPGRPGKPSPEPKQELPLAEGKEGERKSIVEKPGEGVAKKAEKGVMVYDAPEGESAIAIGPGSHIPAIAQSIKLDMDFGGQNNLPEQFAKTWESNYVGLTMEKWEDFAEAVFLSQDRRVEHWDGFVVMDGKAVHHERWTSKLPNASEIPKEALDRLKARAKYFKARYPKAKIQIGDGHNHPSGETRPSTDDQIHRMRMAKLAAEVEVEHIGSVITDGDEFSVIGPNGDISKHKFANQKEVLRLETTPVDSPYQVVAQAAKDARLGKKPLVMFLNAKSKLMSLEAVSENDNIPAYVRDGVPSRGASYAAIIVPSSHPTINLEDIPKNVLAIVRVDKDGNYVGTMGPGKGASAYPEAGPWRVADEPPRFLGGGGMDKADMDKALDEAGIAKALSEKRHPDGTLRVGDKGVPRGTKVKILAAHKTEPLLAILVQGHVRATWISPDNLVETFRRPGHAIKEAAKATGAPSMSIKKIIAEQQPGLSPEKAKQLDEMQLLSEKFKNQAKGSKIGAAEGRRAAKAQFAEDMEKMQAKLDGFKADKKNSDVEAKWLQAYEDKIRASIVDYANEHLPPAARGKFLTTVRDADTISKLGIALERIDDAASLIHKKSVLTDIRKLIERVADSPGVDVLAKKKIRDFIQDIEVNGHSKATYERIRSTLDYINKQEAAGAKVDMPKAVMDELDILGRRPLKEMSEVELEQAFLRLQMLEEIGRTTVKVREGLYLLERERINGEIMADIKAIKGREITQSKDFKDLPKLELISNDIKQKLNWVYEKYMAITPSDVVWDMMSLTPQYAGAMVKHFGHGFGADYARNIDIYQPAIDGGRDIIEKHKLTDPQIRKIIAHAHLQQVGINYLRTFLSPEAIKAAGTLTPQEKELYDFGRKNLEAIHTPLADTVRFNDNMEIGHINNYWPVQIDPDRAVDADDDLAKQIRDMHQGFQKNVEMGALKKRKGAEVAALLSWQGTFENYMRVAAYKIAMSRRIRMLGEIVNSKEFQEAAGDFGGRYAKQFITMMARRGAPRQNQVIPKLDAARKNASAFAIVFRLPTAAVHLTLLSNAAAISGPKYIFGAMRKYLTAQLITKDPSIENFLRKNFPEYRQSHGNDPIFEDAADVAKKWGGKDWWKAINTPSTLRAIVKMATASSLLGNYEKFLAGKGMEVDYAKPNQDAINYAALYTRRAIASPELPHMFMAYNFGDVLTGSLSGNRALTQFHNFPLDRWSTYAHDLPAAISEGRRGDAARFAFWNTMGDFAEVGIRHGYKAYLAAALAGVGYGAVQMDDDEEGFWKEFFIKLVEKPPFVPDLLNIALYGRVPTTVFSMAFDSIWKLGKAGKAYLLADNRKAHQSMAESIIEMAALAYPIPGGGTIQQVMRMVMADKGIRFPFYDDRERLNNLNKNGTATDDELEQRSRMNHAYSRFEKMNAAYKNALKEGDRQTAASILDAMKELSKEAKP